MKKNIYHLFLCLSILLCFSSCEAFLMLGQLNETPEETRIREAKESADYEITDAKTGEKKYVKDLKKDK